MQWCFVAIVVIVEQGLVVLQNHRDYVCVSVFSGDMQGGVAIVIPLHLPVPRHHRGKY